MQANDVLGVSQTNQKEIQNVFKLFDIVNVKDPAQQTLLLTWMVNSILPRTQKPILLLYGARGSGKSYTARIIKRLLNPAEEGSSELFVYKPKDVDYLIRLLSRDAVVVLDNVGEIDQETSDIFCNVVTGGIVIALDNLNTIDKKTNDVLRNILTGGVVATRELHTTKNQVLIDIKSKLIVTTINPQLFKFADLRERTIKIEITRADNYLPEKQLNSEFEACRGEIFGAILSLAQGYLRNNLFKTKSVGKYLTEVLNLKPGFDNLA
jgi:replication-associated recombination protein RarA